MKTTMQAAAVAVLGMALAGAAWGQERQAFEKPIRFNISETDPYHCEVEYWIRDQHIQDREVNITQLFDEAADGHPFIVIYRDGSESPHLAATQISQLRGTVSCARFHPGHAYRAWMSANRKSSNNRGLPLIFDLLSRIRYEAPLGPPPPPPEPETPEPETPTSSETVTVSVASTGERDGLEVRITVTAPDDDTGLYRYPIRLPVRVHERRLNRLTHSVDFEIPRGGSQSRTVALGKHGTQYRFGGSDYRTYFSRGGSRIDSVPQVYFTTPPEGAEPTPPEPEPESCPVERCDHLAIVPTIPRAMSGDEDAPDHWIHVTNPGAASITFTVTGRDDAGTKGGTYRRELPAYRGVRVKMRDIQAAFNVPEPEGWWRLTVTGSGALSVTATMRQGAARRFVPVERPATCGTGPVTRAGG